MQDYFIPPESKGIGGAGGGEKQGESLKYSMVPRPTQRILKF